MILVDTSAWYAAYVPSDPHHEEVRAELKNRSPYVMTTDYVVDETITLLRARGERHRAEDFARDMLILQLAKVEMVTWEDLIRTVQVLIQYRDKAWSFTDCSSLVVMQRLGIREAISLDQHFHQMPGITVYPHA